jgi:hypothetical protein
MMGFFIKPIGENVGKLEYESVEHAVKFAEKNVEHYPHGYEVVNDSGNILYKDMREEVKRVDLIDMD